MRAWMNRHSGNGLSVLSEPSMPFSQARTMRIGLFVKNSCLMPSSVAVISTQWNLSFSEAAHLLNEAAAYLWRRGQYPEALPLFQRALAIHEQVLGPAHPSSASTLNDLAAFYKSMGNYPRGFAPFPARPGYQGASLGVLSPLYCH